MLHLTHYTAKKKKSKCVPLTFNLTWLSYSVGLYLGDTWLRSLGCVINSLQWHLHGSLWPTWPVTVVHSTSPYQCHNTLSILVTSLWFPLTYLTSVTVVHSTSPYQCHNTLYILVTSLWFPLTYPTSVTVVHSTSPYQCHNTLSIFLFTNYATDLTVFRLQLLRLY